MIDQDKQKLQQDIDDLQTAQNLIKHAIKLKQDNLESSYNISNQTINDLLKVARQLILSSYQKY